MVYEFDLKNSNLAYMFGFIQTDGHLSQNTRNRGRLEIEIQVTDKALLERFQQLISVNSYLKERTRDTNFKRNNTSAIWTVHDLEFRTTLNRLGVPYGRKSKIITTPTESFSEIDYWRGIIDGDGSLGITSKNLAFISLVTTSSDLYSAYVDFIYKITGKIKVSQPNKRDNAYNICVFCEDAQQIVNTLYYSNCLCLDRKRISAKSVMDWVRPINIVKKTWEVRKWTPEEDFAILNFSCKHAMKTLNRTEKSIKTRIWRLQKSA